MNVYKNLKMFMNDENSKLPMRSTKGSAGYDIFMSQEVRLAKKTSVSIDLPFYFEIENDRELSIRIFLRSSFGIKKKVRLMQNGKVVPFITCEANERENKIELFNDGDSDLVIASGEHFAQFIVGKQSDALYPTQFEPVTKEEINKHNILKAHIDEFEDNKFEYVIMEDVVLEPFEQRVLASGLKAFIQNGTWLGVYIEKSMSEFVSLANGVAVIDADYYGNLSNDGHCFFAVVNNNDKQIIIPRGTSLLELWTEKYYTLKNEVEAVNERTGGIGHTSKTQG